MALPVVAALVGKLATSAAVQSAAAKVANDIYGRIMAPKERGPGANSTIEAVATQLDQMATRDELIASFAALQADLDRRHQRANLLLAAVIATQAVVIAIVLLR